MRTHLVCSLLASAILAGCSNSTDSGGSHGAVPPSFSVTPTDQWSGGTVQVRASNFAASDPTPVIVTGTDTASVSRLNDSTFAVTVPQGPSASLHFVTTIDDSTYDIGDVHRFGLSNRDDIGARIQGNLLAESVNGDLSLLGVPPALFNLRAYDLQTGAITDFAGVSPAFFGPTESDHTGWFAMVDSSRHGGLYSLGASGTATLQAAYDTTVFFSPDGTSFATRLSDSVWIGCVAGSGWGTRVGHPPVDHLSVEGGCSSLIHQTGANWALVIAAGGSAIVDATTGDATPAPGSGALIGAASSDGSHLLVVRGIVAGGDSLVRIDPMTGTTSLAVAVPAVATPLVLSADPGGSRLYLLATRSDASLALFIFNAADLSLQGTVPLGESCPDRIVCSGAAIVPMASPARLVIVAPSNESLDNPPVSPRWTVEALP